MTKRERLEAAFDLKEPDRVPVLDGWIAVAEYIQKIAGASEDEYWADPQAVSIRAYERLGADGLVTVFVPAGRETYRCVDKESYAKADRGKSLEEAAAEIDAMPTPEAIEKVFDFEAACQQFCDGLREMQARCGDMLWAPAQFGTGAKAGWYGDFGYEAFFLIVGLYPDRARKLMEVGGAHGRCRSRVIGRAIREGVCPRAVLCGEDICTQRGPMISMDFLEKHYASELRRGLAPIVEAGGRPVWHCDGDVRPMLDMLIECGVRGLQGFQPECGMVLEELVTRRTREGEPLVIFGPLAVTTELPVFTPEEVEARVRRAIETCRGKASLVLFTANTITPDVPLENVVAMYRAAGTNPRV